MKKKICMILIAVFVAVLGTSTYFIIDHYKEANKQAELYGELADLVNATAQTDAATEPAEQIPYSEEKMLLPELAELYQQNGDLVGWISIADTMRLLRSTIARFYFSAKLLARSSQTLSATRTSFLSGCRKMTATALRMA